MARGTVLVLLSQPGTVGGGVGLGWVGLGWVGLGQGLVPEQGLGLGHPDLVDHEADNLTVRIIGRAD